METPLQAETIAAIATPAGRGGIGIVRISGPLVEHIATEVLGFLPPVGQVRVARFRNSAGETVDQGVVLFFKAPHSFTGEDILELQGHGGPVVMDMMLELVLGHGARVARPGEFSERAFLNDKIDLAQAEAIADLIDSVSEQAAKCAMRSLQGEFSKRVHGLLESLINLRMYVESAIDFPEEEIDFLSDGKVLARVIDLSGQLKDVLEAAKQGAVLREGIKVVLAGKPNVGKSSILNRLCGNETAIVTPQAGTTRDTLKELIHIDGIPLHLVDTAGLRFSDDEVEQEGVKRAWREIADADIVLLIVDVPGADGQITRAKTELQGKVTSMDKVSVVKNKIDLSCEPAGLCEELNLVKVSAKTGEGIDLLRDHLKARVGFTTSGEGQFIARRRHVQALKSASDHVHNGLRQLQENGAGELLAEDLHLAQRALSEITGEFTNDDLLGRIFSTFCIGK